MGKRVYKRGIIFLIVLFMILNSVTVSKPVTNSKKFFSSSFIQYWYAQDWDDERWENEMKMLRRIGVGELILQTVADTKSKYAVYPTVIPGYTHNDRDMVGTVLRAADSVGIKIRVGLGFSDDWWDKGASDINWINSEAENNKNIIKELIEMYGHHPSFKGWYIPYEFSQVTAVSRDEQLNLNRFYKQITTEIKGRSTGDIMISPFYSARFSWFGSMMSWSSMIENVLGGSGVDILALQDGVGAAHVDLSQVEGLFRYTRTSTDKVGVKLYGNIETFTSTKSGNIPASYDRIFRQFSIEGPYVEDFVAFSLNHFQNGNVGIQKGYYDFYRDYYLANR